MYDEQIIIYDLEDENGDFFQERRKGRGRSLALMEQIAESQKEEDNTNKEREMCNTYAYL